MSSLTRCHLQYASRCSHFLSYLVNMICLLLHIFHVRDSAERIWFIASFFFNTPETHNNTANCLLSVMIANCISLTCSECLKCRGSHLLVRCPRHTASTGGEKECLSHPFRELLLNKIKGCSVCSSIPPFGSASPI